MEEKKDRLSDDEDDENNGNNNNKTNYNGNDIFSIVNNQQVKDNMKQLILDLVDKSVRQSHAEANILKLFQTNLFSNKSQFCLFKGLSQNSKDFFGYIYLR